MDKKDFSQLDSIKTPDDWVKEGVTMKKRWPKKIRVITITSFITLIAVVALGIYIITSNTVNKPPIVDAKAPLHAASSAVVSDDMSISVKDVTPYFDDEEPELIGKYDVNKVVFSENFVIPSENILNLYEYDRDIVTTEFENYLANKYDVTLDPQNENDGYVNFLNQNGNIILSINRYSGKYSFGYTSRYDDFYKFYNTYETYNLEKQLPVMQKTAEEVLKVSAKFTGDVKLKSSDKQMIVMNYNGKEYTYYGYQFVYEPVNADILELTNTTQAPMHEDTITITVEPDGRLYSVYNNISTVKKSKVEETKLFTKEEFKSFVIGERSDVKDDEVVLDTLDGIYYSNYFGDCEINPIVKIHWYLRSNPQKRYENFIVVNPMSRRQS